jgi:hypothetical protein
MTALLLLFAPLAVHLAAIYALSGYVNGRAMRFLGRRIYLLVMWPGVVVHELSHLAACLLTRTKVFEVKLFAPHEEAPGTLVLGYVRHAQPSGPLAATLIGSAPFFGGAAALWLTLRLVLPGLKAPAMTSIPGYLELLGTVFAALEWRSWMTYLLLYLIVVFSSHIAPSRPDMLHSLAGVAGLAAIGLVFAGIDRLFSVRILSAFTQAAAAPLASVTALLGYGLAFTAAMAAAFAIVEASAVLWKR